MDKKQQFTPIDDELRKNIKKVFESFDKDNSGFIDRSEIVQIAKELGQEVTEEEVDKIFADIDTNKDRKISLKEFETWWCYGKVNKMGRLVYFKLKAMNMLDKAKNVKSKYGKFLSESYDSSNIDEFKFAIRVGEMEPKTRLDIRGYVGKDAEELFEATKKEMNLSSDFSIVFRLKAAIAPAEALNNLKETVNGVLNVAKEIFPDEAGPLVDHMFSFEYRHDEENIYFGATSSDEFFASMVQEYQEQFIQGLDNELKANFQFSFGLKNDFKTLYEKYPNQKVVLAFLEGMWLIFESKLNANLLKTVREQTIQMLDLGSEYMSNNMVNGLFMTLMKGTTAELNFGDLEREKAEEFLKGIGSGDALESTPTFGDLLDLAKQSEPGELISAIPFLNEFLQFLRNNIKAEIGISLKIPKLFVVVDLKTAGIREIYDYIMDKND
jgi:Ca2+-binding protein (EF-Hand superfamily)